MTDVSAQDTGGTSKKGLMIGMGLGAVLGAAGFYAVWSGMIMSPQTGEPKAEVVESEALEGREGGADVAFVELDPIVVTLPSGSGARHLKFRADLEVPRDKMADVEHLKPRVMDALNAYLRAVEPSQLSQVGSLVVLREQMRRRISLVVGSGLVSDLLVIEFVLN